MAALLAKTIWIRTFHHACERLMCKTIEFNQNHSGALKCKLAFSDAFTGRNTQQQLLQ